MDIKTIYKLTFAILFCCAYASAQTKLVVEFTNDAARTSALMPYSDFIFQLTQIDPELDYEPIPESTTSAQFLFPNSPAKFGIEQAVRTRENVARYEITMESGISTQRSINTFKAPDTTGLITMDPTSTPAIILPKSKEEYLFRGRTTE